jgi:hypothetical protein
MFDGVKITIGGTDYIVPPLNLGRIRKLKTELEAAQGYRDTKVLTDEQIDTYVTIIHSGFERNYPDITREEIEEMIDLANLGAVYRALMSVSGFVPGGAKPGDSPAS